MRFRRDAGDSSVDGNGAGTIRELGVGMFSVGHRRAGISRMENAGVSSLVKGWKAGTSAEISHVVGEKKHGLPSLLFKFMCARYCCVV